MPANPVYLIALPTKNDPMLGYLSTSFQDHVRLREKFGYKVDDAMWSFYQRHRDRRSGRQVYRALRRSLVGLLPVPAGQERPPAQGRHLRGRPGEDAGGRGARRRPRDRSRRADLGSQPAARGQGQRALRRCESVPLGRAHPRVRRLHPQCPAAAHPVRRPQRLHRPSGHRRDVEPGITAGAGSLAGIVGRQPAQGPDRHLRRPERQGDHGPGASGAVPGGNAAPARRRRRADERDQHPGHQRQGAGRLSDRRDAVRRGRSQQLSRHPPRHRRAAGHHAPRLFGLHHGGERQGLGREGRWTTTSPSW